MNFKEEGLRCKNCMHNNHYDFDKNIVKEICGHTGGYYSGYEKCPCVKFDSYSNLDYLEWKYDQTL